MATLSEKRFNKLHDKWFNKTISDKEKEELYDCLASMGAHESLFDEFLYTSHPD
jgi:hypothetical protein